MRSLKIGKKERFTYIYKSPHKNLLLFHMIQTNEG